MTASHTLEREARAAAWLVAARDRADDVSGLVVHAAGTLAAAAAAVCGLVIALRRLSGAVAPAAPGLLVGAVASGIALVLVADRARRGGGSPAAPLVARCGLAVAVAALALPPRAAGPAGWVAVAGALVAAAVAIVRQPAVAGGRSATAGPADTRRSIRPRRPRPRLGSSRRDPQPGLLRQRFERRELPAGAERVRGRVVVAVPAGAKAGFGHLGFCPAFVTTPTVEVMTAYDGVEVIVVAAEVLPWGVRVECRLAEPAEEPLEIPVDLVASAPTGGG
jgi:hypothetical protein